ncbi:uncharacterized protein (DUF302 family) [Marinobacter pelagius]|uniref:Uncharacterized protein (DUF302 family) n=1 Tax=Marinobacter pelagius TaxID=379482 RepID=A0A366GWU1_9GAMM|nr:DUF302 domain-containing protein [Marinobacter pelagius]RBP32540.1 uncharacterized protein (DUF302 family) [Marinobacter pelagius]
MNFLIKPVSFVLILLLGSLAHAADGLIVVKSNHGVAETADRLEAVLQEKGMTVMNRINHAAGAESAGIELRPTELVIFGNPKVGTPLMQCAQSVAVDLPQKALIWEDEQGQVWLGYNDPAYLKARHGIEGCDEVLGKVNNALASFAEAATK